MATNIHISQLNSDIKKIYMAAAEAEIKKLQEEYKTRFDEALNNVKYSCISKVSEMVNLYVNNNNMSDTVDVIVRIN